jgi:S-adenosylmethionine:tRNA ribosyltransferase-isomerase
MLVADGTMIHDQGVRDLVDWLRPGDRMVLNDTRVIPARLFGTRTRDSAQGRVNAKIEVTLLEPRGDGTWSALIKPLRKVKLGEVVRFGDTLCATLEGTADGQGHLRFNCSGDDFDAALNAAGAMPLPPYIAAKRPADARDKTDYQTVWAKTAGAVAAPTASLHFDEALLGALAAKGVTFSYVTLHVGAGTFLPVKVDDIADHKMHAEWGRVSPEAAGEIAATKASGGRVIPVGTTALRLIETAARGGTIKAWEGDTDIFITPGFTFQVADALMTNFHLPKSTLMMLVGALMGQDQIKAIYAHAIAQEYRFFSYGDASLLIPAA